MNESKPWYTSKTLIINAISFLAAFLEGQQFIDVLPDQWEPTAAMFVFGLNLLLRYITVTEIKSIGGGGSNMIVMLLMPSLLLIGCGKQGPNLSPERSVALYANQVAGYLKETKTLADGLYSSQILPRTQYEKTLNILLKANEAGVQLTTALQVYDTATDGVTRGDAVKQVDAALTTLNTLLPSVLTEITDANGRAKVGLLIESVQRLILTIARATLPRPTAYIHWPRGSNDLVAA